MNENRASVTLTIGVVSETIDANLLRTTLSMVGGGLAATAFDYLKSELGRALGEAGQDYDITTSLEPEEVISPESELATTRIIVFADKSRLRIRVEEPPGQGDTLASAAYHKRLQRVLNQIEAEKSKD